MSLEASSDDILWNSLEHWRQRAERAEKERDAAVRRVAELTAAIVEVVKERDAAVAALRR